MMAWQMHSECLREQTPNEEEKEEEEPSWKEMSRHVLYHW